MLDVTIAIRILRKILSTRLRVCCMVSSWLVATGFAGQPALAFEVGVPAPDVKAISASPGPDADVRNLLAALPEADFNGKRAILERLIAMHPPQILRLLNALIDGSVYQRESDKAVFITELAEPGFRLIDPVTFAPSGTAVADDLTKIVANNSIKRFLRVSVAKISLNDTDVQTRLAAAKEIQRNLDEDAIAVLRQRRGEERDAAVRRAIDFDLAVADLGNIDVAARLRAIEVLKDSLSDDVYNPLQAMLQVGADGSAAEPDARVRAAADEALGHMQSRRSFYHALEMLFFGLSLGSVLVLAGIGLAITFGVMGVINMAHGELMMLGAYTIYVLQLWMPQHVALATLLSIPAAFLVSGAVGVAIERGIVRFLYGRPLFTLLATFGVSLILQQLVRSVFSPLNRSVATPAFMSGSLVINDALSLTWNRLYIIAFMLLVFFGLLAVLQRTSLGLKVRAVAQNRAMAQAMGVRTGWVDAATFGLGSGVAGVAGVALSQLTNVGPNLGQSYIIDSFMVVVFGGGGSLWGTLISGMSLGVANNLLEPAVGAVMAKILVLVFLILFIQKWPRGLFPQKGRGAQD